MRILTIILTLLYLFFGVSSAFAGEPPTPTTPANGSVVSSSTLNWQAPSYSLYSTNPYRVQVDNESSFPSSTTNKDYYTKNTYYSPVLNAGNWYWRIKVKDSSGTWSDWSNIYSFTLQSNPSPTPTPTPSPTPTPTPATPTPTPKPTPTPAPKKSSTPNPTPSPSSNPSSTPTAIPTPSSSTTSSVKSAVAGVTKTSTSSSTFSSTPSANVKVADQKQVSPVIFIGLSLIALGATSLGYLLLKQKRRYNPLK